MPCAPLRRPLLPSLEHVTAQDWDHAWASQAAEFDQALLDHDVDAAWVLLSLAAEDLLTQAPGADFSPLPRSRVVAPIDPGPRPRPNLRPCKRTPSGAFVVLPGVLWSCSGVLRILLQPNFGAGCSRTQLSLAYRIAPAPKPSRMPRWLRLLDWRLRPPRAESSSGMTPFRAMLIGCAAGCAVLPRPRRADAPVHPIDIVAAEHAKWSEQWTGAAPHTPEETRAWCERLGPAVAPWSSDLLHPAPAAVQACLRASAGRSAGLDAWAPSCLARLPLPFFQLVARLWRLCVCVARLPQSLVPCAHHVAAQG